MFIDDGPIMTLKFTLFSRQAGHVPVVNVPNRNHRPVYDSGQGSTADVVGIPGPSNPDEAVERCHDEGPVRKTQSRADPLILL